MDIFRLIVGMLAYGFMVGLIIGIGAYCYAFISIRFEARASKRKGKIVVPVS